MHYTNIYRAIPLGANLKRGWMVRAYLYGDGISQARPDISLILSMHTDTSTDGEENIQSTDIHQTKNLTADISCLISDWTILLLYFLFTTMV